MIELIKLPDPVPSAVLLFVLFKIVGVGEVLQQTPRTVTGDPPSLVIFPPLVAEAEVTADIGVVMRTGGTAWVFKVNSLP